MKALVGAFNQDLVGAFSVIVKTDGGTDGALDTQHLLQRYNHIYSSRDGGRISQKMYNGHR